MNQLKQHMPYKSSTGAALILVLGILSIISVLTVQIIEASRNLTKQQIALKQLQQSYWYAKSGEEYARYLSRDYILKKNLNDEDTQLTFPIENGQLKITLKPMQNCFNINSFSERSGIDIINRASFDIINNPKEGADKPEKTVELAQDTHLISTALKRRQFSSLFALLDIEPQNSQLFADRLIDWLDEDNSPSGAYGAESTYYSSATPPRLTPNNHTLIAAEMQSFLGEDYPQFKSALPYLCSRPGDNKLQVNINQLDQDTALLLSAVLLGKIDQEAAKEIIKERPKTGFNSLSSFWQLPVFNELDISMTQKNSISIENRYFEVDTNVKYKEAKFKLQSLIRVGVNKKVHVFSRQYGVSS